MYTVQVVEVMRKHDARNQQQQQQLQLRRVGTVRLRQNPPQQLSSRENDVGEALKSITNGSTTATATRGDLRARNPDSRNSNNAKSESNTRDISGSTEGQNACLRKAQPSIDEMNEGALLEHAKQYLLLLKSL